MRALGSADDSESPVTPEFRNDGIRRGPLKHVGSRAADQGVFAGRTIQRVVANHPADDHIGAAAAVGVVVAAAQFDAIVPGTAVDGVAATVRTDDHVAGIAGVDGDAAAWAAVDQCRLAAADDQPCAGAAVDDVAAGATIETVRARPAIDRGLREFVAPLGGVTAVCVSTPERGKAKAMAAWSP